jgi:hypothetical protein
MKHIYWNLLLASALVLAGCEAATNTKPVATTPTAQAPTVANLTGSWTTTRNGTYSDSSGEYTTASIFTFVFAADGTFQIVSDYVKTPKAGGASTTTYTDQKGTYSVSGTDLSLSTTAYRTPTSANDTTTGWTTPTTATTYMYPSVLYNRKLYSIFSRVCSAQGTTSGLVGTWATTRYVSSNTSSWTKTVLKFNADLTYSNDYYENSTATFGAAPNSTTTGTYTQGNGTIILTQTGSTGSPMTLYYTTFGSYLVFGDSGANDATLGAFTKK